jgi:hypothetical protein
LILHKLKRLFHFSLNSLLGLRVDIDFIGLFPKKAQHKLSICNDTSTHNIMAAIYYVDPKSTQISGRTNGDEVSSFISYTETYYNKVVLEAG